MATKP
jgi:hypothetical protein